MAALGGLLVIGTNRHESRRVDRQLRGRAGRQGDPGETRFFVSLEDDLLVRHGGLARLIPAALVPAPSDEPVEHAVLRREIARAQRVIEGQHWDIRRTVARYARRGRAAVRGRRRRAPRAARPVEAARAWRGRAAIDLWRQHLARCADLRDGAHLARLGGREPLSVYTAGAAGVVRTLCERSSSPRTGSHRPPLVAPATTWTYLVNDDPFRHTMGSLLTGPGGPTIAMYAAAVLGPLFLAWGVVDRWWRGRKKKTGALG